MGRSGKGLSMWISCLHASNTPTVVDRRHTWCLVLYGALMDSLYIRIRSIILSLAVMATNGIFMSVETMHRAVSDFWLDRTELVDPCKAWKRLAC